MTKFVALDEPVRHPHNRRIGPVIQIHHKHLRFGMRLLKIQKRLRVCRAESVYTLVLIPDHEKIPVDARKKRDNLMLNARRILRLIHADIPKPVPVILKQRKIPKQHFIRINHLIIVIHQPVRPQHLVITFKNL